MSQHHPVSLLILNGKNTDNDVLRSARVQKSRIYAACARDLGTR